MSRRQSLPSYTLHRPSGQARVRIQGRDIYLGPHDSAESRERYAQLLLNLARQHQSIAVDRRWSECTELKVKELVLKYCLFAEEYYGTKSKEFRTMRDALKPLVKLFGNSLANDFGPRDLKLIRQSLIEKDICRPEINRRISRIRRAFRWATSEELVPPSMIHGLASIQGLARGRSGAREPEAVRPVPDDAVERTLPYCSPQIRAMIQLQRLAGMRPGEVTIMRGRDIDRSSDVWIYRPERHKGSHLGIKKEICLGPQAQAIVQPFLDRPSDNYLFSPKEAEEWRNEQRSASRNPDRKTKIYPSELRARARRKVQAKSRIAKRPKRERFDTDSYRRAIVYAIAKAGKMGVEIVQWHPHQLRHLRATEVRKEFGLEAAQVTLGHTRADVTQIYAERNSELAIQVARKIG